MDFRVSMALVLCVTGCAGSTVARRPPVPSALPVEVRPTEPSRADRAPDAAVALPMPPQGEPTDAPPTWGSIYARYLGPGTDANCARAHCHANVMTNADAAYRWLSERGYIQGDQSALVHTNSCLRWFGGNMPPKEVPGEHAMRDLTAWAAAGARNN